MMMMVGPVAAVVVMRASSPRIICLSVSLCRLAARIAIDAKASEFVSSIFVVLIKVLCEFVSFDLKHLQALLLLPQHTLSKQQAPFKIECILERLIKGATISVQLLAHALTLVAVALLLYFQSIQLH